MPSEQEVQDVPRGKIEANALSDGIAILLKAGMSKAPLVEEFFNRYHDIKYGEKIAKSFQDKYYALQGDLTPNQIFSKLQVWAGGTNLSTPEHELSVLTVIAYFFERCNIFEEPRGGTS